MTGLRSHVGTKCGFSRSTILSWLMINEQMRPITPPMIKRYGKIVLNQDFGSLRAVCILAICLQYTRLLRAAASVHRLVLCLRLMNLVRCLIDAQRVADVVVGR